MRFFAPFVVLLGMALSAPSEATTLARLTPDQMTDAADYVVRGTVTAVWTEQDERGNIWSKARVDVVESYKNDAPEQIVVESPGGEYRGILAEVALAARYDVDEDVVLFLSRMGAGDRFGTVAMYGGKYTVRTNPADGSEMVVHFSLPYTREYDHRFIPNPPAGQRVSLDSVVSQVRARAALGWDGQPIPGISADHLRTINRLQPGVK